MNATPQNATPQSLAACARGEITLAEACGVDRASLAAARTLAYLCSKQGRDDLARTILEGCVALDDRDPETFRAAPPAREKNCFLCA